MRIALLSDVHGNPIALDAVLTDIRAQGGVDIYWVLGDVAAIGYDPVGVIERLVALPCIRFVHGNTDRYLVTGERPPPTLEDAQADPSHLSKLIEVAQSFAWTQGVVTATGWLNWLAELPLEQRMVLPDGTRLLGVHAAPGTDDGPGVHLGLSDVELHSLFINCGAEVVCVGHTHIPLDRSVAGIRIINPGSVSNPLTAELQASYVLLDANPSGYHIQFRQVAYDWEAVIVAIQRSHHPASTFLIQYMRGQLRSRGV